MSKLEEKRRALYQLRTTFKAIGIDELPIAKSMMTKVRGKAVNSELIADVQSLLEIALDHQKQCVKDAVDAIPVRQTRRPRATATNGQP